MVTPGAVGALAVWGGADLPDLGDQLLARVAEQELLARLPGWRISHFAPMGWDRPAVSGLVAEPLGAWELPGRTERISRAATLSVISPAFQLGGAGLGPLYGDERAAGAQRWFHAGLGEQVEREHPVLLSAVRVAAVPTELAALAARAECVSVRDVGSRDRLVAAGVERDIEVVAHPALLLRRVVDFGTLPVRRAQLRALGELPDRGEYVVLVPGEHPPPAPVIKQVLVAAGVDHLVVFGDDRVGGLPDAYVLAPELVFEDQLAVMHGASLAVVTDEHRAAAAAGLGTPWLLVDPTGEHRPAAAGFGDPGQLAGSFDDVAGLARTALALPAHTAGAGDSLTAHYDRVAEAAERALRAGGRDPLRTVGELAAENRALRHALWRLRERQLVERERLTEALVPATVGSDMTGELDRLRARNAELDATAERLEAKVAEYERELLAWQQTKLVRWTRPLRQVYARWLTP